MGCSCAPAVIGMAAANAVANAAAKIPVRFVMFHPPPRPRCGSILQPVKRTGVHNPAVNRADVIEDE
jgi:hypothetical protein